MSRQIVKRSKLPQDFDIYCLYTKCFECVKCEGNNFGEKCPKFAAKGRYMREYDIEMTANHRIVIYRNEKALQKEYNKDNGNTITRLSDKCE